MEGYRPDRLNFSHLFYFYVTAREGSIKATSEKLHISQPTVSDQIKLLEEFLDCQLFERRNRGLYLTKEGELALEYAERIFDLSGELTSRLRNKIKLPRQSLDIGLTPFMSQYFLYEKILPAFQKAGGQVHVVENERHLLLAELEEENLDVIFLVDKEGLPKTVSSYKVGTNRTYALAHKKFKKYQKSFPESLSEIPYMGYTKNSGLKYEIDLFFSQNGITPSKIGESDDIDLFELITKKGLGFTIVSEVGKKRLEKEKDIIVLGELEELQTNVYGVIRKGDKGPGYELLKNSP